MGFIIFYASYLLLCIVIQLVEEVSGVK